jgi:hypothetical protein
MPNYYTNDEIINAPGYEIYYTRFSDSIINDHFTDAKAELENILNAFYFYENQIIKGGGGLSSITQSLGKLLVDHEWKKAKIESEHRVGEKILTSESHEVDHYKSFDQGNIGLEIEWNNKDPFYDRDLENFRKLHQIGELSIGIIITRGASLQTELYHVYHRFLEELYPFDLGKLSTYISFSDTAKGYVKALIDQSLSKEELIRKVSTILYSSKFGQATTHMNKLLLRLNRGVGNPCPFILIGIGKDRLKKNEGLY